MNKKQRLVISKLKFWIKLFKNIIKDVLSVFSYILRRLKNPAVFLILLLTLCFFSLSMNFILSPQNSVNSNYIREAGSSWEETVVNYLFSEPFVTYSRIACLLVAISGGISGLYILIEILLAERN